MSARCRTCGGAENIVEDYSTGSLPEVTAFFRKWWARPRRMPPTCARWVMR